MTLLTPALVSALTASTGAYFRLTPKYTKTNSKYTPNSYGAFGVTVWCQLASLLDTKKGRRFGVNFGVREKRALHGFAVLVWCAVWCRLVYKCTIFGVQHRFQTLARRISSTAAPTRLTTLSQQSA